MRAFGGDVAVVEAVERRAELLEELEGHPHAVLGVLERIVARLPRADHGAGAERVAAGPAERVPVGHAEAEVVLHRLAFDHFVGVVTAEGERVLGLGTFVPNLGDVGEGGHVYSPWGLACETAISRQLSAIGFSISTSRRGFEPVAANIAGDTGVARRAVQVVEGRVVGKKGEWSEARECETHEVPARRPIARCTFHPRGNLGTHYGESGESGGESGGNLGGIWGESGGESGGNLGIRIWGHITGLYLTRTIAIRSRTSGS